MSQARLLLCEKTGRWAVALRRELAARPIRIYETRSLAECRRQLELSPASFAALELTVANVAQLVAWIEQAAREFPQARFAVLGQREAREHEWAVREAGAIAVVFSPRRLAPIARMARRRLASAPEEELTFQEQIQRRLPWKRARSGGVPPP